MALVWRGYFKGAFSAVALAMAVVGCGGGGGGADAGNSRGPFTLNGTLSGLATGQVVTLQNTPGESISLGVNGAFNFATPLEAGEAFAISVKTQPNHQQCSVASGTGTMSASTPSVTVTCVTPAYAIGGQVAGLPTGQSVTLRSLSGQTLVVSANGQFDFPTPLLSGWAYAVEVVLAPAGHTCSVQNGAGTLAGSVSNVAVTCAKSMYGVGGVVSGLAQGAQLVLQNNGAADIQVTANGSFKFTTPQDLGSTYAVTVKSQPALQTCTVNNSRGTVAGHEIGITVTCVNTPIAITHVIGGEVKGLPTSAMVVLDNNGIDDITITANGRFAFPNPVVAGKRFEVKVKSTSAGHSCVVTQGSGTASASAASVQVTCSTNLAGSVRVGGTVTGLRSSNLTVNLYNQTQGRQETLTLTQAGSFVFAQRPLRDDVLSVSAGYYTEGHICTLKGPAFITVAGDDVHLAVTCSADTYKIGAWVSGLPYGSTDSVGLRLSADSFASQDLMLSSTLVSTQFLNALPYGTNYQLQVFSQPAHLLCTVSNSSGTVRGWIPYVGVSCVPKKYKIQGTVSGLSSAGLSLQLNSTAIDTGQVISETLAVQSGTDALAFAANLPYQSVYNIQISQQPSGNTCMLRHANGRVDAANISNLAVVCFASNNSASSRYRVERVEVAQTMALPEQSPYLRVTPQRSVVVRAYVQKTSLSATQPIVNLRAYSATHKIWADVAQMNCPVIGNASVIAPSYALSQTCHVTLRPEQLQSGWMLSVAAEDASYFFAPTVIEPYKINLVVVPMRIADVAPAITPADLAKIKKLIETRMPFAQANVSLRAPFEPVGVALGLEPRAEMESALSQLNKLRMNEKDESVFYYGFASKFGSPDAGGMGYMPGRTSVGLYGNTFESNGLNFDFSTLLHELGHNLSLPHAPCGTPNGPDPKYPYSGGLLSDAPLIDPDFASLIKPDSLAYGTDVMGYCQGTWFSDYNYAKMQTYMQGAPNAQGTFGGAQSPARSKGADLVLPVSGQLKWMIAGAMNAQGQVSLQPLQASTAVALSPNTGSHQLKIYTEQSEQPLQWSFEPQEVADAAQPLAHFHVVVPDMGVPAVAIEVWRNGQLLHTTGANAAQRKLALKSAGQRASAGAAIGAAQSVLISAQERQGLLRIKWDHTNWPHLQVVHTSQSGERSVLALNARGGDVRLQVPALATRGAWELSFGNGLNLKRHTIQR